ncbi:unnamed protein product, partial [Sphacelaria rigidula]
MADLPALSSSPSASQMVTAVATWCALIRNAGCWRAYAYENHGRRSRSPRAKKQGVVCSYGHNCGGIHVTSNWCYDG